MRVLLIALLALPPLQEPTARELLEEWTSGNPEREEVRRRLRARSAEIPALLKDAEPDLRARAAGAAVEFYVPQAIPSLVLLLKDDHPHVRLSAVRALEELRAKEAGSDVARLLSDPDEEVRLQATIAVGGLRSRAAAVTLRRMIPEESGESGHLRGVALLALARILAAEAVPDLRARLKDGDLGVTGAAAYGLGLLRSKEAVGDLIDVAVSAQTSVRIHALNALFEINDPGCLPKLRPLLQDPEPEFRAQVIPVLIGLGARDLAAEMIALLRDSHDGVRVAAARALARLDHREAIEKIVPLLKDDNEDVRYAVLYVLGTLRAQAAVPRIVECLEDEAPLVPRAAAEVLGILEAREQIPRLVARLKDPKEGARVGALRALGELGAGDKAGEIAALLADEETLPRRYAAIALRKLRARDQVPALVKFAFDGAVEDVCLEALGRIGGAEETLRKALRESGPFFRLEAARYLAWWGKRDGVEIILSESEKPRHFNALNALRRPELWKKLTESRLKTALQGRRADVFRGIAAQLGWTLELPACFGREEEVWLEEATVAEPRSNQSVFELMEFKMDTLDGKSSYGFVLEENRLRLVPRNELPSFWGGWRDEARKEKK